jgi:hypothetical protein
MSSKIYFTDEKYSLFGYNTNYYVLKLHKIVSVESKCTKWILLVRMQGGTRLKYIIYTSSESPVEPQ